MLRRLTGIVLAALLAIPSTAAFAAPKTDFKICWSIYVGWMPWGYIADSGIMKKWADKYGINVEITRINDYVESINQYTAGGFDGCSMTNMDALSIPAGGGVDTTALIIGDFSNGNDAVILKDKKELADIAGQSVNLVELSVSHYLMARALDTVGLTEKDLSVVNTSDADIVAAYGTSDVTAVVTWNPLASEILAMPGAAKVFDSSDIPGEIIDLMVVNTEMLADNPALGKALVGAWYEAMALMASGTPEGKAAREEMAKASGTDLDGFEAQLASTQMFYEPAKAVAFAKSAELPKTMDLVRNFLFDHGILGTNAPNVDVIGMSFADGSALGDKENVKLRFDPAFMAEAAAGSL
ncbi:lipid kinase [Mesorhizobium sp. L-8-10]|uniref:putative urea ABC transporter substrate-binding protein n=1 Tax=unclassified Mesorhizobium TaxID=325217 RepID=UPI00192694D6|nr:MULTISPECIES: putative urea ABC transporter substrate-binding protein [unclassified Mesorhizobium]BCH20588.1 lipid kinase [Mesorhizobium sp. L-8-3]BCH28435.1 lipid kinase [Mesorhizobium sp. L-8-10]